MPEDKKERLTETFCFSCTETTARKIKRLAETQDRKPAWILRTIVDRYIDEFTKATNEGYFV